MLTNRQINSTRQLYQLTMPASLTGVAAKTLAAGDVRKNNRRWCERLLWGGLVPSEDRAVENASSTKIQTLKNKMTCWSDREPGEDP
jgi:hypothetical protein